MNFRLILCITLLAAHTFFAQESLSRDEKWHADLKFLTIELAAKHKNLFFQMKREDFEREVQKIEDAIPKLTDAEIKIEMIRLVALAGDGHTQVFWNRDDFNLFPIAFYRFSDGWFVVRAEESYKQAVGTRLVGIGDTDIEKAVETVKSMVACDNEFCVNDRITRYLNVADFLYRLKLISDLKQAKFTFEDSKEKRFSLNIKSLPAKDLQNPKLVSAFDESKTPTPIYRRNPALFFFREYLADTKTLFIVYRKCQEMESLPFKKFAEETLEFIDKNEVSRVIIDLRQNGGGKESIFRPLANGLREKFKGKTYVVIGRATYSSANNNAFELKQKTKAILVGEPSGQKPNHYGEVKILKLPNSALEIGYSSNFFKRVDGNPPAIMPDISATLSFADYLAGRDVALDAILNYK